MRGEWREVEREGLLFWHNLKMENPTKQPSQYLSQRKTHASNNHKQQPATEAQSKKATS